MEQQEYIREDLKREFYHVDTLIIGDTEYAFEEGVTEGYVGDNGVIVVMFKDYVMIGTPKKEKFNEYKCITDDVVKKVDCTDMDIEKIPYNRERFELAYCCSLVSALINTIENIDVSKMVS